MNSKKMKSIGQLYLENDTRLESLMAIEDIPSLPVIYSPNKSPLNIMVMMAMYIFGIIGIAKLLRDDILYFIHHDNYEFWRGIFMLIVILIFLLIIKNFWEYISLLKHRTILEIHQDKVCFLNDKLIKNFQEISFDKLYYAYHIPYSPQAPFVGGFLRFNYISLSDDGQYYQTHIIHTVRLNVDNHTGHEYALLINTLIQDYHEKHGLQGKVPKITFIQQR